MEAVAESLAPCILADAAVAALVVVGVEGARRQPVPGAVVARGLAVRDGAFVEQLADPPGRHRVAADDDERALGCRGDELGEPRARHGHKLARDGQDRGPPVRPVGRGVALDLPGADQRHDPRRVRDARVDRHGVGVEPRGEVPQDALDELAGWLVIRQVDRVQEPVAVAAHRGHGLGPAEALEVHPDPARDLEGGLPLRFARGDVGRTLRVDVDRQPAARDDVPVGCRRARALLDPVGGSRQERRGDRVESDVDVLPAVVGTDGRRQCDGVVEVPGVGPAGCRDADLADVARARQDRQERTEVVGGPGGLRVHATASGAGMTWRRRAPGANSTQRIR